MDAGTKDEVAEPMKPWQGTRTRLHHPTFSSADWQDLLKNPSGGEGSLQDLLTQSSDLLGGLPTEGVLQDGSHAPEQPAPDVEPSPLMRWTSDGSMMEELLKTFTPGTPSGPAAAPVSQAHGPGGLDKDMSIGSALMALIAQQQEETAAAEQQGTGRAQPDAGAPAEACTRAQHMSPPVKTEHGCMLLAATERLPPPDAAAAQRQRHAAHLSGGAPSATCIPGTHPVLKIPAALPDAVGRVALADGTHQPSQVMDPGCGITGSPAVLPMVSPAQPLLRIVQATSAPSVMASSSAAPGGEAPQLSSHLLVAPQQQHITHVSHPGSFSYGMPPERGRRQHSAFVPQLVPRDMAALQQVSSAACDETSLPTHPAARPASAPRLAGGDLQQLDRNHARPGQLYTAAEHFAPRTAYPLSSAGHGGRALSAPHERTAPRGHRMHAPQDLLHRAGPASQPGLQLAAQYLQEAAHQLQGAPHAHAPAHAMPPALGRQLFMAGSAVGGPAVDAGPPAVLTAGVALGGQLLPDMHAGMRQPPSPSPHRGDLSPPLAALVEGEPFRAKRERGAAFQRPPTGPKRTAVGLPPGRGARAAADDSDSDGSASDAGRSAERSGAWGRMRGAAGYVDEREAKKQLRKEKNRASAAASRARREAYTTYLEEEVAKLKQGQSWLEMQVNAPHESVPMPLSARAPLRHLSI